jgi:hypothetical protein
MLQKKQEDIVRFVKSIQNTKLACSLLDKKGQLQKEGQNKEQEKEVEAGEKEIEEDGASQQFQNIKEKQKQQQKKS